MIDNTGGSDRQRAEQAAEMVDLFASVGASRFDVTFIDIDGKQTGFQRDRSIDELKRGLAKRLHASDQAQPQILRGG